MFHTCTIIQCILRLQRQWSVQFHLDNARSIMVLGFSPTFMFVWDGVFIAENIYLLFACKM